MDKKPIASLSPEQFLSKIWDPGLWEILNGLGIQAARNILKTLIAEATRAMTPPAILQKRERVIVSNAAALGVDVSGPKGRRFVRRCLGCEFERQADDLIMLKAPVETQLKWLDENVSVRGFNRLVNLARAGQHVVCVGAHFGPMTYYIPLLAILLSKKQLTPRIFAVVNASPQSRSIAELQRFQAQQLGSFYECELDFLFKHPGEEASLARQLDTAIESNAWVTTQVDVITGGRSQHTVHFAGKKMRLPGVVGAVRLAKRHGAAILPTRMSRKKDGGFRFEAGAPLSPEHSERELIDQVVAIVEAWFRKNPADWSILPRVHHLFVE